MEAEALAGYAPSLILSTRGPDTGCFRKIFHCAHRASFDSPRFLWCWYIADTYIDHSLMMFDDSVYIKLEFSVNSHFCAYGSWQPSTSIAERSGRNWSPGHLRPEVSRGDIVDPVTQREWPTATTATRGQNMAKFQEPKCLTPSERSYKVIQVLADCTPCM